MHSPEPITTLDDLKLLKLQPTKEESHTHSFYQTLILKK